MKIYINCVEGTCVEGTCVEGTMKNTRSSSRKTKENVSSGRKKQTKPMKKSGKKAGKKLGKVEKSFVKEASRPRVFRCNLVVVVGEIAKLKDRGDIRDCHIGAMMRTPFGGMFKAIFEDKIIPDHVGMIGQVAKKIISAYSEKHDAFLVAGEVVKLTPDDISLTFGLSKHGKKFSLQSAESVCDSEFMRRRFRGELSLKVSSLLAVVQSTVLEDGGEEDFARCLILYMLATVFFCQLKQDNCLKFCPFH